MAFKSSERSFDTRTNFTDSMTRFIADEAAFISSDEDVGAKMDAGLEKIVRHSADKEKSKEKEVSEKIKAFNKDNPKFNKEAKKELKQLKAEDKVLKVREVNLQIEKEAFLSKLATGQLKKEEADMKRASLQREERFCSGERTRIESRKVELKEVKKQKASLSKEKKAAKKSAAKRVSVANFLKGKKDLSNELANNGDISGNAFSDGKTGLVGAMLELVNPIEYAKKKLFIVVLGALPEFLLVSGCVMFLVSVIGVLLDALNPFS